MGFSLLMNFFSYFFSDKVALSMAGAKEADPSDPDGKIVRHVVETLAIASGMPTPKIYIIEDAGMNAFATGRKPSNSAVAFTRGIVRALDKKELEGVAAHELSHIQNRDILVMTIVVALVGVVSMITDFFFRSFLYSGGGNSDNNKNPLIFVVAIVFAILSVFIAQIIQMAISRKREYMADASGALMTRYPEGLASALEKIGAQKMPLKKANTATAHLYISSPFGSSKSSDRSFIKSFKNLFSTHPPIENRVAILREMDTNVTS
jgi:heat shock protein HtpX